MRVRLKLMTEADLPGLTAVLTDPEVLRYTRFPAPAPDDFAEQWYARYTRGRADGTMEAFAAVDDAGTFLGLALAPHIDAEAAERELGYLVAPAARGRGVASELLRQLTDWAIADGALRLTLLIDADNIASLKVARNAGYLREGVLRSTYFKQGMRSDVELWSRLPSDPPPQP